MYHLIYIIRKKTFGKKSNKEKEFCLTKNSTKLKPHSRFKNILKQFFVSCPLP